MSAIISAMGDAFTLVSTIVTQICNQPVLLFCLASSLIPVGIGVFSTLKNAARA